MPRSRLASCAMRRSPHPYTLLAALYLAQGLPFGFFTQALPVLLRERGLSLKAISLTSFLYVPWALKFLWAPYVDHRGTRRGWILLLQALSVLTALTLASVDLQRQLWPLYVALLLFNLCAAMQDVATDGLAVRLLDARARGLGNTLQVGAYRIGMVLGGGLLLWVFARSGWTTMFIAMAAMLVLTTLPVLGLHEPVPGERPAAHELPLGWLKRLRQPGMLGFVLLICAYKFGEGMASALLGPMLRDLGQSKEQIAVLKGTLGSGAGLLGAWLGGLAASRLGRRRALWGCGLLQTLGVLPYVIAASGQGGNALLWTATLTEHLLGGMATVALFTLMMDASEAEHAGTDYTLLACAIVMAQGLSGFAAAAVADIFGYAPMLLLAAALSLCGCVLLVGQLDRGRGPQRLGAIWKPIWKP